MPWEPRSGGVEISEEAIGLGPGGHEVWPAPGIKSGTCTVQPSSGGFVWTAVTHVKTPANMGLRRSNGTAPDLATAKKRAEAAYELLKALAALEAT